MTFLGYLDFWIDGLPATGIKERTLSDYRNEIRRYIRPHMADVRLHKLSPLHLEALYRTLTERGGQNGKPLGPHTVIRVHRVIRKALGDAERKGLIIGNPARLAQKPSTAQDDNEKPAWTPAELRHFLDAATDHEHFTLYRLAALTGMRRAELLGLKWNNVNHVNKTVRVIETLITIDGQPTTVPPKSRRSRRVIDLDGETATILGQHHAHQRTQRAFAGNAWHDDNYVFTTPAG
jgi:integrase